MNILDKFRNVETAEDESKFKLTEETAWETIKKILDFYDIDPEHDFDSEYKKIFENTIQRAIKAVRLGRLEVENKDGTLKVIQHMRSGRKEDDLIYRELDGRAKLAMSDSKATDYHGRIYDVMGALSNVGRDGIARLKGVDLSLCEVLGTIFLAC